MAYWKDHIGGALSPEVIAKSPARAASEVRVPMIENKDISFVAEHQLLRLKLAT